MKHFSLHFRKWYYYLIPGAWKWLRKTEKTMNEPEFVEKVEDEIYKQESEKHPPVITFGKE